MTGDRPLPLSGIRVLDFGHIVAGPFCVRLLADLGADVIKVETATRQGRTGARRGQRPGGTNGRTPHLYHVNRNRRSIDLNLKTERGLAVARQLIDKADVLVENFSSGVMERLGIGYRTLARTNPGLVYCSMASFGQSGPRQGWTGMNVTLQACSGLMLATGAQNDPPIGISNSWNDYIGGLHAAVAIVGALSKRRATGKGRHLDVSQFEASVAMIGSLLFASAVTREPPRRLGSRSSTAVPQGVYRCAGEDQWCTISVQSDAQWQKLRVLLGADLRGDLLDERLAQQDKIDAAINAWTNGLSPHDVEKQLTDAGIPAAAMRRADEIAAAAEWQQVLRPLTEHGEAGPKVIGLPFSFRGSTPREATEAPRMGASGNEALREWLGLDDPAIAELMREEAG
ncbi:MAG TPA: CoA transferase [Stellaceae bacterium]|jgi:crotonobetainyl-CoA:carnitine CoA-transferase CaiB-like acyl-CoA transferase|nr:CoA transferase [Stellaceae bacterium]